MTTTLGALTFTYEPIWEDEYSYSLVTESVTDTMGGGQYVQSFTKTEKGRPITLTNLFLSRTEADTLKGYADVAGATYTFIVTYEGGTLTKTVRFRNENNGGPVDLAPLVATSTYRPSGAYYTGSIYLAVA